MNSAKTASPEGLRPVASPAPVGELVDNPVTGERAVVRVPPQESNRHLLIADLYLRPSGAVSGEHVHPLSAEAFTVVRGQLRMRLDGRELEATPGDTHPDPAQRRPRLLERRRPGGTGRRRDPAQGSRRGT
jgi:quercetin dioxygenase-like cupin family protein